ncbi:hypothetical protein Mgra_00000422 [Meloidogyne graminicola]|uniref:Uncharacterized protein n=1 Tax=Meloidogyne graminicola TaxID=189291 RepID=A0A8T0A3J7_9BILA|nr:hypothetical protein Mgra_00000422 [Meloidogyne graminicola]
MMDSDLLSQVLNCIENLSPTKRYSFIGAVLLADDQTVKFFDYLKINKIEFNSNHLEYICRIALATKNPKVIEPIVDMPDFIKRSLPLLAMLYENLALIYGKTEQLERLEWLWHFILDRKRHRGRDIAHFRFALNRIAHFYRCANKRLPKELSATLSRLDNLTLIVKNKNKKG